MGIFSKRKKNFNDSKTDYLDELTIENITDESENIIYNDTPVQNIPQQSTPAKRIHTLEQKKIAVENDCEKIVEANRRIEDIKIEYQTVNKYLKDIQLIEREIENADSEVVKYAKRVVVLEKDRRDFGRAMTKLSNKKYSHIRENEEDMNNIIKNMIEDEKYCESVKTDMRYLEGERNGIIYEQRELKNRLYLLKGASFVGIAAFIVLIILLLVINYGFNKDTSLFIYGVVAVAAAFTATVFVVNYKSVYELKLNELRLNKAIGLLNKIKIKYVNVVSRLKFTYEKHGVKSSYQLSKEWSVYNNLKKEHDVYNKASNRLVEAEEGLIKKLENMKVNDSNIWINQAYALIDKRELGEIKGDLIRRRNRIKASLDKNSELIERSREHIKNIVLENAEDSRDLMTILDSYEERIEYQQNT